MLIALRTHMKVTSGLILIGVMVLMILAALATERLLSRVEIPYFITHSEHGVYSKVSIMSDKHTAMIARPETEPVQVGRTIINSSYLK